MTNYQTVLIALASTVLVCQTASFAQTPPSRSEQIQQGKSLYKAGKFDEAKQQFDSALKQCEDNSTPSPDRGTCLNALALIAEAQGKGDEAADLYKRALQ